MAPSGLEIQHVTIHGHRRAFVRTGSGPVLLLLHGLACDHTTWDPVIEGLARHHTVIAPDLLGHGSSDKPRADYTLGGFANGMRDLLTVLGIDRVTVLGHSFGGGVAMQFAYQFPERTERIGLISSGGLGPEVTPVIRALTTPGIDLVLGAITLPGVRHVTTTALRTLADPHHRHTRDLGEVASIIETFRDARARAATRHVVRAVVDWHGQVVTMSDRAYLTEIVPMLVVWGAEDLVIPADHAENAAVLAPGARVEVLPEAGHFPHKDHPAKFVGLVEDFVATTVPASYDREAFRHLLETGGEVDVQQAEAGERPLAPVRALA